MKFLFILVLGFNSIQVYAKKCADFSTQQQAQKWYEQRKKSGQTGWKSLLAHQRGGFWRDAEVVEE
ncbi:hypothetical protein F9230_07025 [Acinetobacter johnsonii]|uniref:hypothetical protein n=1 Tax=Acinetobacter johnsonii TaxID=40214 RepID=UPI001F266146|nr:hypothetical protein [Acinetobacter johnsonii]UJA04117.1 hypothetical protein F9230_07025 [Acinetobacter johnsonii]